MIFMCIFWIDVVYMLLGPSYIYMNPTFKCNGHDKILEEQDACPILSECILGNWIFTQSTKAQLQPQQDCIAISSSKEI